MLVAQFSCFLLDLSEFCYLSPEISFKFGNILPVDVRRGFIDLIRYLVCLRWDTLIVTWVKTLFHVDTNVIAS